MYNAPFICTYMYVPEVIKEPDLQCFGFSEAFRLSIFLLRAPLECLGEVYSPVCELVIVSSVMACSVILGKKAKILSYLLIPLLFSFQMYIAIL